MPTKSSFCNIKHWDPKRHDYSEFDCGVDSLNNFLKLSGKKQQANDMTRIYVVVESEQTRILGYHAINVGMMNAPELHELPRGTLEHGKIPVLFLSQIAVDRTVQGSRIGNHLMHHVFEKARIIADIAGCYAILLDAVSDGDVDVVRRRKNWYKNFGFQSFKSNEARMFIPMKQVRKLLQHSLHIHPTHS